MADEATSREVVSKCRGCDGHGVTVTHWHGHTRGGRPTGGAWKSLCGNCYGLGVVPQNKALFRQQVGKGLAAFRERMGLTVFQMRARLSEAVGLEYTVAMLQGIEAGRIEATCMYPDGLIKRVARAIYRQFWAPDSQ